MKFDDRTVQILRNFSTINPSIVFRKGNTISTMSHSRSIIAKAKVDTEFPSEFGIYDLSQFLGAVSLFNDPELNVTDRCMEIRQGKEGLNYVFSDPSLILTAPEKELKFPKASVEFDLEADVLNRTLKALAVIGSPEIGVVGDGESIFFSAINSKNTGDSTYRVKVGETDKNFKLIFLAENIKVLPGDYRVSISKGISHFKGSDLEYYVSVEQNSTYED